MANHNTSTTNELAGLLFARMAPGALRSNLIATLRGQSESAEITMERASWLLTQADDLYADDAERALELKEFFADRFAIVPDGGDDDGDDDDCN